MELTDDSTHLQPGYHTVIHISIFPANYYLIRNRVGCSFYSYKGNNTVRQWRKNDLYPVIVASFESAMSLYIADRRRPVGSVNILSVPFYQGNRSLTAV